MHAEEPGKQPYAWISTQGTHFVDESGKPVTLRGCNVGNWLLLEMWMLRVDHDKFHDQYEFEQNLANRFGETEKDRLMEVYRENWITPRDMQIIKSFGFNVIRLPFNYRLLEDEDKPFELREGAFKWLDRAVELAEESGLYIILDMHGVPGGQSVDHPTGRVGQNRLWTDPICAKRTAQLWKLIANRYKDRPSIAGYDLINEPYNDFQGDIRPELRKIFVEIYDAIRAVDQRHIIFAPAPIRGGHAFYGNTRENGWVNVAFTEHHYPGLFGSEPSMETHANFIYRTLPAKQAELEAAEAPMFIGEWNPVFERLGGGDLMRRYFDEYAKRCWAATIWSYKILHNEGGVISDNWYMVSNAQPLQKPDFATATAQEIEAYFKWLGTMDYVVDEPMRTALTRPDPVEVPLPEPAPVISKPPHTDQLTGWDAYDIGGALTGGQQVHGNDAITIYGGGSDIWDTSDQFRLIALPVRRDSAFGATLKSLTNTHQFAKAGLMARADASPGSPHVMVHAFPDGALAMAWRSAPEQPTTETRVPGHGWPIHLRLTRQGDTFTGEYSADGKAWHRIGDPVAIPALSGECLLGMAVLSHNNAGLTTAPFSAIRVDAPDGRR